MYRKTIKVNSELCKRGGWLISGDGMLMTSVSPHSRKICRVNRAPRRDELFKCANWQSAFMLADGDARESNRRVRWRWNNGRYNAARFKQLFSYGPAPKRYLTIILMPAPVRMTAHNCTDGALQLLRPLCVKEQLSRYASAAKKNRFVQFRQ